MTPETDPGDKSAPAPPSPPEAFFSGKRIWHHIQKYRDSYFFPIVGCVVLYFAIRLVNHLTGRAVIDDPGAIIGGLYNAILILIGISILGAMQAFLIPDVNEKKPALNWQFHLINCACTVGTFWLLLAYIFR